MKKVLIIESKKDMSKRIVDMLQEEKYETYVIVNKIDNMNHIQFKAFDIILLNVELLQKEDIRILYFKKDCRKSNTSYCTFG